MRQRTLDSFVSKYVLHAMSLLREATVYAGFRFLSTCGHRTVTAICFKYLTWPRLQTSAILEKLDHI